MPETISTQTHPASELQQRLSPEMSQRMRFFSLLSMVLLVYVHGYNLQPDYLWPGSLVFDKMTFTTFFEYLVANGLVRFRIPVLFAISGYLFAMTDYKPSGERSLKRLRTLGLPYLLWSAIGIGVTYLWELHPLLEKAALECMLKGDMTPIREYSWDRLLETWALSPIPFQLWFIRTLLIWNLAYPLLKLAVTKGISPKIYFPIVTLIWLSHMEMFWIGGESLLFFSLGIWMQKRQYSLDKVPFGWPLWVWTAIWLVLCFVKTYLAFVPRDFFTEDWNPVPAHSTYLEWIQPILLLMYKMSVFAGLVAIWFGMKTFAVKAMQIRWVAWACGFTFVIYGLHEPILHYTDRLVFQHLSWVPYFRLLTYLFVPAMIVLVCILVGAVIRAISPKAYGLLTGGRGMS